MAKIVIRTLQRRWLWLTVIAVILLFTALRAVNWLEVVRSLQALRGWQLLALLLANLFVLGVQYGRWHLIIHTQGHPLPFLEVSRIGLAGHAVSYFTPGPQMGGEPAQIYLLHTRHGVPLTTATAGVAIDKMLMLVTNFSFLLLGIWVVVQSQLFSAAVSTRLTLVGLALLCLPLMLLLAWGHGCPLFTDTVRYVNKTLRSKRLIRWLTHVEQTEQQIISFYQRHPGRFLLALTLSALGWLALAAEYWLMASFVGLTMTPVQIIFLFTAVRLAILLPLPGGIGSIEASQILVLNLLGLPAALGITLSFLIHGRDILFALTGLWWNSLTLWR